MKSGAFESGSFSSPTSSSIKYFLQQLSAKVLGPATANEQEVGTALHDG